MLAVTRIKWLRLPRRTCSQHGHSEKAEYDQHADDRERDSFALGDGEGHEADEVGLKCRRKVGVAPKIEVLSCGMFSSPWRRVALATWLQRRPGSVPPCIPPRRNRRDCPPCSTRFPALRGMAYFTPASTGAGAGAMTSFKASRKACSRSGAAAGSWFAPSI